MRRVLKTLASKTKWDYCFHNPWDKATCKWIASSISTTTPGIYILKASNPKCNLGTFRISPIYYIGKTSKNLKKRLENKMTNDMNYLTKKKLIIAPSGGLSFPIFHYPCWTIYSKVDTEVCFIEINNAKVAEKLLMAAFRLKHGIPPIANSQVIDKGVWSNTALRSDLMTIGKNLL